MEFLSHAMKLEKRIIENRIRRNELNISNNYFAFMSVGFMIVVVFIVKQVMSKCRHK